MFEQSEETPDFSKKQSLSRRRFAQRKRTQSQHPLEKSDDEQRALNSAIRLLTRREYALYELGQKLKERYTERATALALRKVQDMGYQSDERYASMLVRHMQFSLYGPTKLMMEARRKHVDEDLIDTYAAEVDWDELALQALAKKYKFNQILDRAESAKALAYLARRGFDADICVRAVQILQKEQRGFLRSLEEEV